MKDKDKSKKQLIDEPAELRQKITELEKLIAKQKRIEKKLKSSLKEKEVLLREIHHRVKNNLQVISSIVRPQSRPIKDKRTLDVFRVIQERIRSIAFIHESLYESKDLSRIDFLDYVKRLTSNLFFVYKESLGNVKINVDIKDVLLDINQAVACGLIINELVTNSLKHAFPGSRSGKIDVKIGVDRKGKRTLIVRDTGIGFPESLDIHETETLGMQLITSLVSQIDGTIELIGNKGTTFKITC